MLHWGFTSLERSQATRFCLLLASLCGAGLGHRVPHRDFLLQHVRLVRIRLTNQNRSVEFRQLDEGIDDTFVSAPTATVNFSKAITLLKTLP